MASQRPQRQRTERTERIERLKTRLPPKRERFTPVERLRRRAVASDQPLTVGDHRSTSPTVNDGTRQANRFKLVCWNIEDGLDIDNTIKGLSHHPNLMAADAICLQEMEIEGVDRIAAELKLSYAYQESSKDERTGRGFGNAILSPYKLSDVVTTPMPHVAKAYGRPRAAVSATVEWPGQTSHPISVWSIHAEIPSLSLSKRIAQYTAVAARAIGGGQSHLLIAGDFNTTTITSVVALDELYEMFELERISEDGGPSLRRAGRLFYLDHIYGRGVVTEAVGVERDVIASDHWPLWVDVSLDLD